MKVDSTVVQCLHYLTVDHKLRGSDRGNKENNGSPRDQSFGEPLCSGTRCHKTGPPFVRHWGQKKPSAPGHAVIKQDLPSFGIGARKIRIGSAEGLMHPINSL